MGEFREISKQPLAARAAVALDVLERADDPAVKAERIKQHARQVGRRWRFGAIASTILACKAFPGEVGAKLLDAHLERHGSDALLWRELFADADAAFALVLRDRLVRELHRDPEQRSLWIALVYAPDVDVARLRVALLRT